MSRELPAHYDLNPSVQIPEVRFDLLKIVCIKSAGPIVENYVDKGDPNSSSINIESYQLILRPMDMVIKLPKESFVQLAGSFPHGLSVTTGSNLVIGDVTSFCFAENRNRIASALEVGSRIVRFGDKANIRTTFGLPQVVVGKCLAKSVKELLPGARAMF